MYLFTRLHSAVAFMLTAECFIFTLQACCSSWSPPCPHHILLLLFFLYPIISFISFIFFSFILFLRDLTCSEMAAVKNRRPRGVIQINQNCSIEISSAHPNRFELLTDNNVKVCLIRLFHQVLASFFTSKPWLDTRLYCGLRSLPKLRPRKKLKFGCSTLPLW